MANTYKIAVVGDWNSVAGFSALGLDVFPVVSALEAKETIQDLASKDTAVIYLTEQLAEELGDVIEKYNDELTPAIIMIPGQEGSLGIGKSYIQRSIERAVGADIL